MEVVSAPPIFQLVKLCLIGFVFICRGSAGYNIFPLPAIFADIPPVEGIPDPVHQQKPSRSYVLSPEAQPNGSNFHPLPALPPLASAPLPNRIRTTGLVPSYSPSTPSVKPSDVTSPPPVIFQQTAPSSSSSIPEASSPHNAAASPPSIAEGHVPSMPANGPPREVPVAKSPKPDPTVPAAPESLAPSVHQPNTSSNGAPVTTELGPVASPPRKSLKDQPPESLAPVSQNASSNGAPARTQLSPVASSPSKSKGNHPPESLAPSSHYRSSNGVPVRASSGPVASPPRQSKGNQLPADPIAPASIPSVTVPHNSHATSPSPSIGRKNYGTPFTAPPAETPKSVPPANNTWHKDPFSAAAPSIHKNFRHSGAAAAPFSLSPQSPSGNGAVKGHQSPAPLPSFPFNKHNHTRKQTNGHAPTSSPTLSPPNQQGPAIPPLLPANQIHGAPPSPSPGPVASGLHHKFSKPMPDTSPAPAPSPSYASGWTTMPLLPRKVPPPSPTRAPKTPVLPPIHTLPPPPPNEDCSAFVCTEPYANTPPGSPCGCVLPMQVALRLSVALYTFFPLVSDLAQEIASGVFMKQSQVRIMGANAASQQPEKTIVLIDLVPLGTKFDNTTAFLTYHRFWHKEVAINTSLFGDYEVLYVRYLGLPASPPVPSDIDIIDSGPYPGSGNNGRAIKPLGVDIQKGQHKNRLAGGVIAIITLSASVALILCSVMAWILLFRRRNDDSQPMQTPQMLPPPVAKPTGATASMMGSGLSSASMSFGSSSAPYAGSAKTFSANDIEKATNNFDNSRILGEGGFGRVYKGNLEDNTEVAVKVLKRDDQQGGREFLAEIEMLSRLHHRNLVKLIGICTEERARCLVYELIPNGSVESHLHGVDKESAPLDWDARIKIALGAARGLAYLHEDSSPRVIHRDFKASNILLEHDFTPKVSDFGLARTAMDEENRHISTRVMGTFGYVAPEYAMTGHLLVKSDVYSYGVVLLELLTGRKPVDMSQPPGQENLVAWARPLLTSREGLEMLIDPSLGPDVPFDNVAKVAAIASMCVQPEVSHRPFMGEVVQALKLICNECDEAKEVGSRRSSQGFSIDMDAGPSAVSGHLAAQFQDQNLVANYDSEPDVESGLSLSEIFSTSAGYARETSGSLRRCSSSGPRRTGHNRRLWERMRRLSGEGVSEHGIASGFWAGSR